VDEALAVLRQAAGVEPENDFVHGLLGRAFLAVGKNRQAVFHFRRAAMLNTDDTYSRMMVDLLTQRPVPAEDDLLPGEGALHAVTPNATQPSSTDSPYASPGTTPHVPTDLERLARQEEEAMAERLGAHPSGRSGYRIRRVVLDAGHGGFDSGAVGAGGLREKDVNLAVAVRCAELLSRTPGLRVFLTRTADYYVPLSARTAVANQYSADLFVSFHCNASTNREAQGMETYSCSEGASSKEALRVAQFENSVLKYDPAVSGGGGVDIEDLLFRYERRRHWQAAAMTAATLQRTLAGVLPFPDRGIHAADFYVLRKARMPAILLETGFLSNGAEERLLGTPEQQARIAVTVADAIGRLAGGGGL